VRFLGLVAAALVLASCAGGADVTGDRRTVGDVTMAFTVTPARTEVGKAVRLTIRLTNHGGRVKQLPFTSGQMYDFWVTRGETDDEVWRWSDDMSFTQATSERTIASQDSISFAENWTASTNGDFIAHAVVRSEGFDRELTGRVSVGA
jgi:hypothetical protein